jgi:hypothetical protein
MAAVRVFRNFAWGDAALKIKNHGFELNKLDVKPIEDFLE